MRLVFMGTPDFAVPSLKALKSRHDIYLVVTQPDKPAGRGRKLQPPPVKTEAVKSGLCVLQTDDANHPDVVARIQEMRPQVIVVVAYGCILKKELLDIPSIAPVNLHASLLPKYRGVSPINRAIMDGETVTGVTTIRMDEGVDTGPILLQERVKIGPRQTAGELFEVLAEAGAALLRETIDRLVSGPLKEFPQDDSLASYAKKLKKSDGIVPWDATPEKIVNHVRGVTPWPGAVTYLEGAAVKVLEAEQAEGPGGAAEQAEGPGGAERPAERPGKGAAPTAKGARPGTVVAVTQAGPVVVAGAGYVVLRRVCPQGKKPMSGTSWARGRREIVGRCFSSRM